MLAAAPSTCQDGAEIRRRTPMDTRRGALPRSGDVQRLEPVRDDPGAHVGEWRRIGEIDDEQRLPPFGGDARRERRAAAQGTVAEDERRVRVGDVAGGADAMLLSRRLPQ